MQVYWNLVRHNGMFRRLWAAQAISLIGDWFNQIVLLALVAAYSDDPGLAISIMLVLRFGAQILVAPLAGVLLDRMNRKRLLIISDVARIFTALGFLLANTPDRLWLLYVLVAVQSMFAAIFEPGRSALLPALLPREQLIPANIVMNMTWSFTLAIGSALGGLVAGAFGTAPALLIDAATFAVSAVLIAGLQPQIIEKIETERERMSFRDFTDGLRYVRQRPALFAAVSIKAGGSIGALDTLVTLIATSVFVVGVNGAGSLGIFWAAFGVGALIGPPLFARFNDGGVITMRRLVFISFLVITGAWLILGAAGTLAIAALALVVKAVGSNIYWTYSSIIIQKTTDDAYLGRVFALDMLGFQVSTVFSIAITGAALSLFNGTDVRVAALMTGLVSLVPLTLWGVALRWLETREHADVPMRRAEVSGD